MSKVLDEALRLRALGFAVHWLVPREKRPILQGWATANVMTMEELEASYKPDYNVGFRAGKHSVVGGKEICVLDIDVRGGPAYQDEAHAAARSILGDARFDVISGSGSGRHRYLAFPLGTSPASAATTLRQSDLFVDKQGRLQPAGAKDARPAWVIELLSTGKNVVLPPSIHPDTGRPYQFL